MELTQSDVNHSVLPSKNMAKFWREDSSNSAMDDSQIRILPPEMLEHVFSFLPLHDRKSASLVCRSWYGLAFSKRFMRHVTLRLVDWEHFRADKYSVLQGSTRCYRHIMAFFGPKECSQAQFDLLLSLMDLFGHQLESFFCLTMFTVNQLLQIVEKITSIKQLVVGVTEMGETIDRPFPVLKQLKDLGSLSNMLQCTALDIPTIAPNLEHLTANFISWENVQQSLKALIEMSSRLKSLEMFSSKYYFPIDDLRFPQLKSLKLSGKITDTTVAIQEKFFRQFPKLRHVTFDYNIQDVVLDTITKKCPYLRTVFLKSTQLGEKSLRYLNRLKHLKFLGISGKFNLNLLTDCKPIATVETFHLHQHESENDGAIFQRFTKLLPNVTELKITLNEQSTIRGKLPSFCRAFTKLRKLEIADRAYRTSSVEFNAYNESDDLMQLDELVLSALDVPVGFVCASTTLKRLRMKFIVSMTDQELLEVIQKYPNLRYLEVACCRKITRDGIQAVRASMPDCVVNNYG